MHRAQALELLAQSKSILATRYGVTDLDVQRARMCLCVVLASLSRMHTMIETAFFA
jgi:hypothetical protein